MLNVLLTTCRAVRWPFPEQRKRNAQAARGFDRSLPRSPGFVSAFTVRVLGFSSILAQAVFGMSGRDGELGVRGRSGLYGSVDCAILEL